jgi:hypothetical protein
VQRLLNQVPINNIITAHLRARHEISDEEEWLLESDLATRGYLDDDRADKKQEDDQEVDRDDTDTHMETIFGRRRPDSIAVEWSSKVVYVLEFKRTSD